MQNSKAMAMSRLSFCCFFSYTVQDRPLQCTQIHIYYLYMHVRKHYHYELLRRLGRQIPEISEVTIGISLSTGTPPTTHWMHKAIKSLENLFSQRVEPTT